MVIKPKPKERKWRKRFAILPLDVWNPERVATIWLEFYWRKSRSDGDDLISLDGGLTVLGEDWPVDH